MLTSTELLRSLEGGHTEIDAENLIVSVIKHVGGVDKFAEEVASLLTSNDIASTAKVRVLAMVADFVKYYTESKLRNRVDLEDLSLEDLESVLKQFMVRRMAGPDRNPIS
jgi:hypothetical protein